MAEMTPPGLGEDVGERERSYTLGGGVYGGAIAQEVSSVVARKTKPTYILPVTQQFQSEILS